MDTKSTKSELPNIYKFLIFLLVILFAFLSGTEALSAMRANLFYKTNTGDIKDTAVFLNAIDMNLKTIASQDEFINMGYSLSYEEFIQQSDEAKNIESNYDAQKADALKLYGIIQKLKKLNPDLNSDVDSESNYDDSDGYYETYEYSYDDYATVPSYYPEDSLSDYSIEDSYSSAESWLSDYNNLRNRIFSIVSDATSESTITNEIENKKSSALMNLYTDYNDSVSSYKDFVTSLKNVSFLLIDEETGKSIRSYNSKRLSDADFIESIKENSIFNIVFTNGKLSSPTAVFNKKSSFLSFLNESSIMKLATVTETELSASFNGMSLYLKVSDAPVSGDGYFNIINTFNFIRSKNAKGYTALSILFAVLSTALIVLLSRFSGKRKDGSVKLVPTDKVLFGVHFSLTFFLVALIITGITALVSLDFSPFNVLGSGLNYIATPNSIKYSFGLSLAALSVVITTFVLYIVRNCKAGKFSKRFILGLLSSAFGSLKENGDIPLSYKSTRTKTVLITALYMAANIIFFLIGYSAEDSGFRFLLFISFVIFNLFALIYIARYIGDVLKLTAFADEIKRGNFSQLIEPQKFLKPLRSLAFDLSACRDSIHDAVDNAVKGERMKTALITNVSHDLKTPLTSIITYTSLLKLCKIDNEDAVKYIDVLDDKTKKLQRLIDDLTEASKATSGNVKMNFAIVNLYELALQAAGENSDMLEGAGLDLVLSEENSDVYVSADSQHTFRVIDNLFSNAKKYSLPGSRVYVDVYAENNYGVLSIKNISKEKLNVAPDELTERFVRGENSRTSEGSGLGLSIARSFTELQRGIFSISIDGDLFTAVVKLPLYIMPENNENKPVESAAPANLPVADTASDEQVENAAVSSDISEKQNSLNIDKNQA